MSGTAGIRRVLALTGANGFLGRELVTQLLGAGESVHALVRSFDALQGDAGARPAGSDGTVSLHVGDLLDPASVHAFLAAAADEGAARGVPVDVVHAAALISYHRRDAARSRRVNVEGTHNVIQGSIEAGVRRLCHVSSVVTVGHAPDERTELDEDAPFNGASLRCTYVTTKKAAEDLVRAARRPPEVCVVCPGAIFGASTRPANTNRFLDRIAARRFGPFAPPGSLGVVGLADTARGVLLVLDRGLPGERYLLCESSLTLFELMTRAARELGVPGPRRRLPTGAWRCLAGAAELLDRVLPLGKATPETLRLLGTHFRFSSAKARALGWRPRPFDEVLREAVAARAVSATAMT